MDQSTRDAVLKRLERKADIMRMEFKSTNNHRKYDMDEMLTLIWSLQKSEPSQ